jgi:hypothetical protein
MQSFEKPSLALGPGAPAPSRLPNVCLPSCNTSGLVSEYVVVRFFLPHQDPSAKVVNPKLSIEWKSRVSFHTVLRRQTSQRYLKIQLAPSRMRRGVYQPLAALRRTRSSSAGAQPAEERGLSSTFWAQEVGGAEQRRETRSSCRMSCRTPSFSSEPPAKIRRTCSRRAGRRCVSCSWARAVQAAAHAACGHGMYLLT